MVDGHANKELVFLYKPDKTLIQADLFFNLPATEQYSKTKEGAESGLVTKMFVNMMNTRGNVAVQKRVIWYGVTKDRGSFEESIRRINGWEFEKVVPCHGDVIESGAKGVFQRVFEWQLKGAAAAASGSKTA